jgi:TonB-linked SusC/RagA family outer membrane protein
MRKLASFIAVLLFSTASLFAQNRTVTGKVTDDKDGSPLQGVSVTVKGTTTGTTTSASGTFSITVPSSNSVLVFTFVNYKTIEQPVKNSQDLNIIMSSLDKSLQEVVITGYSTKKKSEFTGATSRVSAKQIEQVPIATFEQILQGRAPGLYIASGSGQPGTSARVNIRGVGSISGGNSPLYVLDGIPIEEGVFRTMNPNDFESVDVLKDAAGAGLYGSRGANGVIVITSKKGKQGKVQMSYRGLVGVSQPMQLSNMRLMNSQERLEYEERVLGPAILSTTALTGNPGWDYSPSNPRFQSLSTTQRATEARLLDSIRGINTFWPDIMTRNARFRQHELNASGGANNISFYTSLSVFNQQGIIHRSNLDRYTFRANVDYKTERLTVAIRSSAGWSSQQLIESEAGVALANPIAAAYLELPYVRFKNPDGSTATGTGRTGANAYDRLFTTTNTINQFKGNLGITLQYNIWKGIAFKTTNGVDWRNNNTSRFINPASFAGSLVAQGAQGSYNEGNSENLQLISTTGLVYNRSFSGKHVVNASLLYEGIRNRNRAFNATGFGINSRLPNTPAGITPGSATNNLIPGIGGGRTLNGLSSTFLVADYTFDKRYTFSGTIRRDVPSQVPINNRENIFWSAGASWNIIAEKFMEKQNIFQDARLRVSYGETGNVNGFTSDFGFISTYGNTNYAGAAAIVPASPGNEDYRLESQVLTNIGIDLAFWNRRARLTADYYVKDSRNLFVNQPLSRTTGFASLATNVAKLRNSGVDFALNVDVISKRDLLVTVGVNGGFLKNRVRDLGTISEFVQGTSIVRVGYSLGSHFTVGWVGVDPQSGNPIYEDINGNPTNIYSAANNRAEYGTFLPSFTGGATLDITWKNLSISALLSTAQNVKRFNNEAFFYETTNSNIGFNKRVDLLNSWQKPGDITNYQRIGTARQFSSRDVQDASFIRFRNLQVGYNFVINNQKIGIRSIRLWGQGQNLFTWTKWQGFDPEESNNIATYEFPNPRTYTLGLDINF